MEIVLRLCRKYDDRRLFGTLGSENGLEYCNSDFSTLIARHFYTPCEILVRCDSVMLEFKT